MNELVEFIKKRIEYRKRLLNEWKSRSTCSGDKIFTNKQHVELDIEGRIFELEDILNHYYASHSDNSSCGGHKCDS